MEFLDVQTGSTYIKHLEGLICPEVVLSIMFSCVVEMSFAFRLPSKDISAQWLLLINVRFH
jgi:hypothetical protein